MSRIFIRGSGAVSPAGWGAPTLTQAVLEKRPIPTQPLQGPTASFTIRSAPAPNPRPACLSHPRLRRASAISQYATAAAVEAIGNLRKPEQRLGIVLGVHAASIRYSERFFGEVLRDPATASPVLFPETVINAPASHLACALGSTHLTYSVLGDQTAFFQALLIGVGWLAQNRADIVLVISAEESAWTVSAAARYFARDVVCGEGAGALCLMREDAEDAIELKAITDPSLFSQAGNRSRAAATVAEQFAPGTEQELLIDSRAGSARWDAAEESAWKNWRGASISPRAVLGEALSAATAWQFIIATELLRAGRHRSAIVSTAGSNQQAIAARLGRAAF